MPSEQNKELVRRLLQAVRDGWTPAVIEEFFAAGYRRHLTPHTTPITAEEQRLRATRFRDGFPDAQATLEDIVADGDRVAYRLTMRGTHRGTFLGIAPTGRQVTVSFFAIVRIDNDKLAEEWGGLDVADLLQQLRSASP